MNSLPEKFQVLDLLFAQWSAPTCVESVPTPQAIGRVLAEPQYALHDLPVVRASGMDGVGVSSARFQGGVPDTTGWKCGVDYVRADTGDDFDDRFDAVIRIEDVTFSPDGTIRLSPSAPVVPGLNIRNRGSTLRQGALLAEKDLPLRACDLAALAMGGIWEVPVYRRPRVAFIPTGSELIPIGEPLSRGKNYDTNSLLAQHMLLEMGAEPVCLPIVKDSPAALREALFRALEASDVALINGGSSKGDEDFNTRLLQTEGTLLCHGAAAVPGRPIGVALVRGKPVINIPGPAAAAFYCLDWCVRPVIARFLHSPVPQRQTVRGVLTEDLECPQQMAFLCRIHAVRTPDGGFALTPLSFKTVGAAACLASNAIYVSPVGEGPRFRGDVLEVELLRNPAWIREQ